MNFKIVKISVAKANSRYEVRAWDGSGDDRVEWRRRFESRSEAQSFVDEEIFREREVRRQIKRAGGDPMSTLTFQSEYENWKATRYPDLAPGWRRNLDMYWKEFEPRLARLKIHEMNSALMRDIERDLRIKGNSRSTVQRKIVWIQSVLNYAVLMERLRYNPIARFKPAKPLKADLQFWEKEEAISFLRFTLAKYPPGTADHWKYLAYFVALNTALRSGELWALRPSSLRESFGVIHVSQQVDLSEGSFRPLKGKVSRNVPLSSKLASSLKGWIHFKGLSPSELLLSPSSGPMDHNNFKNRVFSKDLTEWKGKRIKFHGLRHTAATLMLDAKVDIRTVQAILGHKSLETTMRYVHALGQNVRQAGVTFSLSPHQSSFQGDERLKIVTPIERV